MVLLFDGTNDYVDCGNHAHLWSRALTNFSFSFWIFPTSMGDGNDRRVVEHGVSVNQGFGCYISGSVSGRIHFRIKNAAGTTLTAHFDGLQLYKWQYVTCVYDNTLGSANLKIYVNGTVGGTTANLTETITLAQSLLLGDSTTDYKGYMKDFKFWRSKSLSSTEILSVYAGTGEDIFPDYSLPMLDNSGNPVTGSGLLAYPLNGGRFEGGTFLSDGIDDYMQCGNESSIWSKSKTKFSFSIWVRIDSALDENSHTIVDHGGFDGFNGGFRLYIEEETADITFTVIDSSFTNWFAWYSFPNLDSMLNKWIHITCVYDNSLGSGNVKMYVDAGLAPNSDSLTEVMDASTNLILSDPAKSFNGQMKDFRFWSNKALNLIEIVDTMNDNDEAPTPDYWLPMSQTYNKVTRTKDKISHSLTAALTNGTAWSKPASTVLTNDFSYNFFLGYRIMITSNDESQTYFVYDSHGSKPFKSAGFQLTLADDETDMAVLNIEDSNDLLDDTHLAGGVKYFVWFTQGETAIYQSMFVGYGELLDVVAQDRNVINKFISIFGTKILATWRYLNYNRAAKLSDLDDPAIINDPNFTAHAHVTRAISKQSELLYDKIIIKDKAKWDDLDIHKDVKTILSGIALGTVTLWDFMQFIKNITGSTWGTKFENGKETFYFKFPEDLHTDIIFKSGYEKNSADLAEKTAYVYAPFTKTVDTTRDVNHLTILHGITRLNDIFISGSSGASGSESLTFKALTQYLPLPADAKRLKQVNLKLSMRGEVSSPENKVNGEICLVDSNNKPLGRRLDKFNIPLSDIKKNAEVVSVDIDIDPSDVSQDTKVCIKLYQRSGTDEKNKGDPNNDSNNTILWHHNNITNTAGQYESAKAVEGDRHKEPLDWKVTDKGPVYACSIFSDIQRIQTVLMPDLFGQYGVKEHLVDVSDLRDKTTVINYLHYMAHILSLPKTYIASIKVKIPNNWFFRPSQIAYMTVSKPKINTQQRIKRVSYNIPPQDQQVGLNNTSRYCQLSLVGSYNPADSVKFNCDY